ncbi:MAG: DUF924 domain-containing protein [Methylobacteriaceae bacterium]|nr:DUF924 domain-containing protein [Methylobacteriaceae bacterium]
MSGAGCSDAGRAGKASRPEADPTPDTVLAFWREAGSERWFDADPAFDAACRARFLGVYEAAAAGRLAGWEATPDGALALAILLDQMPRNMFRGTARAWSTDALALSVAERALARGDDGRVAPELRRFFYLPFMHAEDLAAQERSVALNEALGDEDAVRWARHHRDVVARFGRFPHRNATLGRASRPDEIAFLKASEFRG